MQLVDTVSQRGQETDRHTHTHIPPPVARVHTTAPLTCLCALDHLLPQNRKATLQSPFSTNPPMRMRLHNPPPHVYRYHHHLTPPRIHTQHTHLHACGCRCCPRAPSRRHYQGGCTAGAACWGAAGTRGCQGTTPAAATGQSPVQGLHTKRQRGFLGVMGEKPSEIDQPARTACLLSYSCVRPCTVRCASILPRHAHGCDVPSLVTHTRRFCHSPAAALC